MTDIAHSERAHARLSPSGAKRFMACPGSVRLSEGIPDESSVFANEGTAAHELAEILLTMKEEDANTLAGRVIDIAPGDGPKVRAPEIEEDRKTLFKVTPDMVSAVNTYLQYARWFPKNGYDLELEQRLDIGHVVKDMFGTADCLAYSEKHKHLHVVDYKHGAGVAVEVEHNAQLMCYALGAVKRYGNRPVEKVTLTIVQPRASHPRGPVRSWETTPQVLMEFADELANAADLTEDPNAPLFPGEHCQFCPAAPTCPALRELSFNTAMEDFDDQTAVSGDQIAEWLDKVGTIEMWCKKVREYANAQARDGNMPTGYKFVEKRATRKWKDEASAVPTLQLAFGLDDAQIYAEPSLRSVAQIEKIVGKAKMGGLRPLITQQSTGLILVPDSDPRQAAATSGADEFDDHEIAD